MDMSKIVIYQIFTRLFGNQSTKNLPGGSIHDNGCGKLNDISDVALSQIKALGITHVWYTGVIESAKVTDYSQNGIPGDPPHVVKGMAGSPYAIKDYYSVDPDLAVDVNHRMAEFEALVKRSHNADLKVLIDFVPNHVSRTYRSQCKPDGITDLGQNDDRSQAFSASNNFYYLQNCEFRSPVAPREGEAVWHEMPAKVTGNDCFNPSPSINDWYETIKLNYGVDLFHGRSCHFDPIPDTWHKMLNILMFWAEKQIDGFRCDMAEMVPVSFWNWAIRLVKEKYPHIIFVAEVYNPSQYQDFINVAGFDWLYDKVGMYDTVRGVIEGHRSAGDILQAWNNIANIHHHMLFFLENHDEQRIASTFFAGDALKGWPGFATLAMLNSNAVMLYFGQELGVDGMEQEGFSGLDGRTTIFDYWGVEQFQRWVNKGAFNDGLLTPQQTEIRHRYQQLLNLALVSEAVNTGHFYDLWQANTVTLASQATVIYPYLRYSDNEVYLFVANFSADEVKFRLQIPEHAFFTAGLSTQGYFKAQDAMNPDSRIQFPAQIAFVSGVGMAIPGYHLAVFKLK
jgi:glycosidase